MNIYIFLAFTMVGVIIYYLTPARYRKYFLLLYSIIFYSVCSLGYLGLLLMETVLSFIVGRRIENCVKLKQDKKSKVWLAAGIVVVVAILCIFKYFNFFIGAFQLSFAELILPVGISYYSFKILSYIIDVYHGKCASENSLINYGIYIMFYPHLLCGPIARPGKMLEQLKADLSYDDALISKGLVLIISGLFKKVVIADRLAAYVNTVFQTPSSYPSIALILGAIFFAIQLYCDFSGYSEIAIGTTNLFGLKCESNFSRPYLSRNIRDFWKRWHISLSSWLKDYIYIPLGGNRVSAWRRSFNVLITFLICGIWHGSQWHYVVWGIYHGLLNIFSGTANKKEGKIRSIFNWILTMMFVTLGWIFFRANSLTNALEYIWLMISRFSIGYNEIVNSIIIFTGDNTSIAYCVILALLLLLLFLKEIFEEYDKKGKESALWTGIFLFCIILLGITGNSSFLYANF